ncbi:MAG: LolA family protein [Rhodospirillales bacterium]
MTAGQGLRGAAVRLLAAVVMVLAVAGGTSAAAPAPAALTPQEGALVGRIEAYFNGVRTMRARFLQVASTGQTADGSVALQRPGRMRIEYDPPVPVPIVADGTWLIYHDRQFNQISYLPLGSTPAGILVEDEIDLDGGSLTITGFSRAAGVIRISVVRTATPADGSLTLVFSETPLQLQQWRVVDAQGVATTVSLSEIETGVKLDPELFRFVDPRSAPPAFPQ